MFEPIIINKEEQSLSVDLSQKLLDYEIKALDKIPPPEVALRIDDAIIGTLGNILSIIGKAKSRKSFFIGMAVSAAVSSKNVISVLKNELPTKQRRVLYFDTEQGKYHVQLALKRICKIVGVQEPNNLNVYGLRALTPSERLELIEYAIYNTPELGIIFIDGIKDLITSINDEEQATMIVSKLMKWSEEKNILITTVLHQNKSDTNARGHIGTELNNKAETVLSVSKSADNPMVSIVNAEMCRNIEPQSFAFEIDENGIPYISDFEASNKPERKLTKKELYQIYKEDIVLDIFNTSKDLGIGYGQLLDHFKRAYLTKSDETIGEAYAKDFIKDLIDTSYVLKSVTDNKYYIGTFESENEGFL
jgi:hypothetical protein